MLTKLLKVWEKTPLDTRRTFMQCVYASALPKFKTCKKHKLNTEKSLQIALLLSAYTPEEIKKHKEELIKIIK